MTITPLPTPVPTTADPTNFDARADLFLAALPTMVVQFNADAATINIAAGQAVAGAAAAAASAAAAVSTTGYLRRSTASLAIGTGAKAVTGLASPSAASFANGDEVTLIDAGNSDNRMWGIVSLANMAAGTMTVTVASGDFAGSGTLTNWIVMLRALESLLGSSVAEILAGATAVTALTPKATYDSFAEVTLTSAAGSLANDMAAYINAVHTLTENTTLADPSNPKVGQSGDIRFVQHASAAKTLSFGSKWKRVGGAASISTTLSATDILSYKVITASLIHYDLAKAPS